MIDKILFRNTIIKNEFDDENFNFWFDKKEKKFLHQIDTFYYSVKLENDFTKDSNDPFVKMFREHFNKLEDDIVYDDIITQYFCDKVLNFKRGTFARIYNVHLEKPEYFDIFIASKVPSNKDSGESVTCEMVIQLRSYMLWMYGVNAAFKESYEYVNAICSRFGFTIKSVQENRVDYCWHSNYLVSPEKFFAPEKFYKMRVDRFHDANMHTEKVGMSDYEIDYISMGKRSDKVFIRIYLKTKEVIEQNYKAWFFKMWLFHGLINRFDFYVYEKCYIKHSWSYLNMARLEWYLEFGKNEYYVDKCKKLVDKDEEISDKVLQELADLLTPKVTLIMNVEYQTMRKHTKTYELPPLRNNSKYKERKRIYDFMDCRKLITDYLTHYIFRLVEVTDDSNKSRADYCGFWKALRITKMVDVKLPPEEIRLTRNYTRNLNSEILKRRVLNSAITYGIYTRGINEDEVTQDFAEVLCQLNDNDIHDSQIYKSKKVLQFNETELKDTFSSRYKCNYNIVDITSGEVINNNIPQSDDNVKEVYYE